ncbi:NADPH-dependent FMN reductase [Rhodopila sp.]|uniref:NADPH-dependent FMN reductase n=1 Tax=Rhodopila sp. TaxID=2480087 RepID=UPI003D0F537B
MTTLRFLGISGSLRAGSFNTFALRAARELAPEQVSIELADISGIPLYNDDVRIAGMPPSVVALQSAIAAADAVIIATPEYNFSVSGVLKNAIDWISRTDPQPFRDKPVGIIGASMGMAGTARAQYDLRKSFLFLDAHVLNKPEIMIAAAHTRFDAEGRLTDEATRGFLKAMLVALRDWTLRLRNSATISV